MARKKQDGNKPKATKEEGVTFVSSFGTKYTQTETIDAEVLQDYLDNNHWAIDLAGKQKNLLFANKYSIEILNEKGEADQELAQHITNMCENVRLWSKIELGYADGIFGYGIGIYNQIWGYEGAEYKLQGLRYLPAFTFRNPGSSQSLIYSELLQGITLNDKKEIEFHQTNDSGETKHLKTENLFWIKDPSTASLTGRSIIKSIIPIIEMLKYSWKTIMQYMNRVGAPIIFIKITNPQQASERLDGVSDVEYATKLLEQWGENTGFILRENMEKMELNITKDSSNLDTLDALNAMIINHFTPSSFISRTGGQSLGNSDNSRETLFYNYIRGIHIWVEDQWERIPQMYLDMNGYKGYIANMHIPSLSIDHSEIELQQAKVGNETHSLSVNERRKRLGAEPLDEKGLKELEDEFARAPQTAAFASNTITPEQALQKELQAEAVEFSKDIMKAVEYEEE